jgi:hypothetical protein
MVFINKKIKKWKIMQVGKKGEKFTYREVKKYVKKNKGILLKNIRLPLYNESTEIDLLIISNKGIVCVENKHVSGIIKGDVESEYWIQIKSGNNKKKMYNPIKQNEGHIKCLRHHLLKNGFKNVPIWSFVIFSNDKTIVHIRDYRIGNIKSFQSFLRNFYFREPNRIYKEDIVGMINKIKL